MGFSFCAWKPKAPDVRALEHVPRRRPSAPSNPQTLKPSNPQTLKPSNPQTLKPSNPQTLKPSNPQTLKPSNPQTLKPSNPQTLKPSNPQTLKPSNPQTLKPSTLNLRVLGRECGNNQAPSNPVYVDIHIYIYISKRHIYIYICERDLLGPFHVYHLYEEFNLFTY